MLEFKFLNAYQKIVTYSNSRVFAVFVYFLGAWYIEPIWIFTTRQGNNSLYFVFRFIMFEIGWKKQIYVWNIW